VGTLTGSVLQFELLKEDVTLSAKEIKEALEKTFSLSVKKEGNVVWQESEAVGDGSILAIMWPGGYI
jgi:DNA polymerase III sliding clamp (beta) subunit (PCNA family)